ncbi:MAG: aminotransferase, partial [Thermoplasmata archaeon]
RIGHMGLVQMRELLATIGAIEASLAKAGYKFEKGAGVAAVEDFM